MATLTASEWLELQRELSRGCSPGEMERRTERAARRIEEMTAPKRIPVVQRQAHVDPRPSITHDERTERWDG